jgi:hypothetical protein
MLALTARHADIWNARGTPEEAGVGNTQLDEFCRRIGRDPAAIMRGISPARNLFASVDDFVNGVAAYRAAGFTDFQIPWPRSETEYATMRSVARDVIPELRRG